MQYPILTSGYAAAARSPPCYVLAQRRQGRPRTIRGLIGRWAMAGALRPPRLLTAADGWRLLMGVASIWPATERVAVLIDAPEIAGDLFRSAWRLASATRGHLIALIPSVPKQPDPSAARMAEDLNAIVVPITAIDPDALAGAARIHRATIVVVRPDSAQRPAPWKRSLVEELLRRLPGIDIYLPSW